MAKQQKMIIPEDNTPHSTNVKQAKQYKPKVNMIIKTGKHLHIGEPALLDADDLEAIEKFHKIESILE